MKTVMLKIVGKHVHDNVEEEEMQLMTEGTLEHKDGVIYLNYDESELSGLEGFETTLTLTEDSVRLVRESQVGGVDTEIYFKKGERHFDSYATPYGPIELEILTNELENTVTEEGKGEVNIDYNLCLRGLMEGRSKLSIEVR
ncbi:MAG: DUF1934 domain-containing protein [Anaerovoracaceae bacterium]